MASDFRVAATMALSNMERLWQEKSLPKYGEDPLYVDNLKLDIEIGSFISFKEDAQNNVLLVGRIVDHLRGPLRAKVNIFRNVETVEADIEKIEDGAASNIPELVQTREFRDLLLFRHEVVDLAFVFSPNAVVDGTANCQGISNAFICRYQLGADDSELVEIEDLVSFPSQYSSEDQPWLKSRCVETVCP